MNSKDRERYRVHLWPIEKDIMVFEGETLLEACKKQRVNIRSSCGGVASCAQCICRIRSGEDFLSSMQYNEIKLLGNVFHITKERLACQLKVHGDITVDVSDHIGAHTSKTQAPKKIVVRKKREQLQEVNLEETQQEVAETRPKKLGGGRRPRKFKFSE